MSWSRSSNGMRVFLVQDIRTILSMVKVLVLRGSGWTSVEIVDVNMVESSSWQECGYEGEEYYFFPA